MSVSDHLVYSVPASAALGLTLALIMAFTFLSNLLTVVLFTTDRELRTFSDRLVLNLAVADILVGSVVAGPEIVLSLTDGVWVWGRSFCLLYTSLSVFFGYTSVANTLVVSLDQYWTLRRGEVYERRKTWCQLLLMTLTPWLGIFVLFSLPVLLWEPLTGETENTLAGGSCNFPFGKELVLLLHSLLSPFIVIVSVPVIDVLIFFNIRKKYSREGVGNPKEEGLDVSRNASPGPQISDRSITLTTSAESTGVTRQVLPKSCPSLCLSERSWRRLAEFPFGSDQRYVPCASWHRPTQPDPDQTHHGSSEEEPHACDPHRGKGRPLPSQEHDQNTNAGMDDSESSESSSRSSDLAASSGLSGASQPTHLSREEQKEGPGAVTENYREAMQSAHLTFLLGIVLVATCTPFEISKLVNPLCSITASCRYLVPYRVLQAAKWIVLINSSINPVLYFVADQRYHDAYLRFFRRCCSCRES